MPSERHDLGKGHSFEFIVGNPSHFPTDDKRLLNWNDSGDTLIGIIEWHQQPDGVQHGGGVYWVPQADNPTKHPTWSLVSLDPLHLEPSIKCDPAKGGCGNHGFIRNGRWEDA